MLRCWQHQSTKYYSSCDHTDILNGRFYLVEAFEGVEVPVEGTRVVRRGARLFRFLGGLVSSASLKSVKLCRGILNKSSSLLQRIPGKQSILFWKIC